MGRSKGFKHSIETKLRMKKAHTGKKLVAQYRVFICKVCSKSFVKDPKSKYVSFCSNACQTKNWEKSNPEKYKNKRLRVWYIKPNTKNYKCCICGFRRSTDFAHVVPKRDGGEFKKDNIYVLCPNHHRLLDRGLLTKLEKARLKTLSDI